MIQDWPQSPYVMRRREVRFLTVNELMCPRSFLKERLRTCEKASAKRTRVHDHLSLHCMISWEKIEIGLNLSLSRSTISLVSQFIIWLFWHTWSVMADLWCLLVEALLVVLVKFLLEIFFTSCLCCCLRISPIFTFSHWLHGILYTTPAFLCFSTLSFGWIETCLGVVWSLITVATLCLVNMRCIFSVNEWTYGTVATALDFSYALSFLIAFLMFICSLTFFIAQSG